jgi:hypothetical protein
VGSFDCGDRNLGCYTDTPRENDRTASATVPKREALIAVRPVINGMQGLTAANVTEIARASARPRRRFVVPSYVIAARAFKYLPTHLKLCLSASRALFALS